MSDKTAPQMPSFEEMFKTWRDTSLNQWAAVSQQLIETEPVTQMMKASFDTMLASQKQMRQGVNTWLESLDLPNRGDLARLSQQVLSAETRVAECEDAIDTLRGQVGQLASTLAVQQAQIELLTAQLAAVRATAGAPPAAEPASGVAAQAIAPEASAAPEQPAKAPIAGGAQAAPASAAKRPRA
jgi:uncharacterized coiled-coil protein SlyX